VHENLGTALEEIGQYDEAIEEYLAARTLSGEDESIVGELREAYTRNELRGFRQKQLQLAFVTVDWVAYRCISNRLILRATGPFDVRHRHGLKKHSKLGLDVDFDQNVP
jgi:tetratricopeptide (TPR) repeat protein